MSRILIAYHTRTGRTRTMAETVAEGVAETGMAHDLRPVTELEAAELLDYGGIIIGSPTYYGMPPAEVKSLFDQSVALHGKLSGKVGGAFATADNIGGGNETCVLALLQMMLVHGMVIKGTAQGDHYGPVGIGELDSRSRPQAKALGTRVAELVQKLGL